MTFATNVNAQIDSTLNKEVEVIKSYQPSISEAYKIGSNPKITDTINYSPTFEYHIFSRDIPIEKNINHLPVVQLGNTPRTTSNTGYAKGGIGNALTPYGELIINTSPSKNSDFGIFLYHFSSNPKSTLNNDLKVKSPYSNTMAKVFVKNYFRKSLLDWDISYQRNRNTYYGFAPSDPLLYTKASPTLNTKQVFNTFETQFKLQNTYLRSPIDYTIKFNTDYFKNKTGQSALHANYEGLFTKKEREYSLLLDTKFEYFLQDSIINYHDNTLSNHHYIHVRFSPQLSIKKELYELKAGFNIANLINGDSTLMWNISPKINFTYHPIKGVLTLFAGTDGGFTPNGYQQVVTNNPYINPQLDIKTSEEALRIYGGFKGKISQKLSYLFDVDFTLNKNEAFYYLSQYNYTSDTLINNTFDVSYDDINTLRFGGQLRYSSPKTMIALNGNYYNYDAKTLTTLSHMPNYDFSLSTSVQITKEIKATIDATIIGAREAEYKIESFNSIDMSSQSATEIYDLNTIVNINMGAEYTYTKNISFFIDIQNLLNQNYELWQGYNNHGMLLLLGGRYIF
jgi:hypothetical protein